MTQMNPITYAQLGRESEYKSICTR